MAQEYLTPGVSAEERAREPPAISGVATSDTAFVDCFSAGPIGEPVRVTRFEEFLELFGGVDAWSEASYAIHQYYLNGGGAAWVVRVTGGDGAPAAGDLVRGIAALDGAGPSVFNILCLPAAARLPAEEAAIVYAAAVAVCAARHAFLLIDIPEHVTTTMAMAAWTDANASLRHPNAAVYFPRLLMPDPLNDGGFRNVGASGTMAGLYARLNAERGVWTAPAGARAVLQNAALANPVGRLESEELSRLGINSIRVFGERGVLAWGARTLYGVDGRAGDYRYIAVRRLALYLVRSIARGLEWAAFEPNGEALWAQVRATVEQFLLRAFSDGALQGHTPRDAFFVRCDRTTMTQGDINDGTMVVEIGFAPLRPAEFIVLRFRVRAGEPVLDD